MGGLWSIDFLPVQVPLRARCNLREEVLTTARFMPPTTEIWNRVKRLPTALQELQDHYSTLPQPTLPLNYFSCCTSTPLAIPLPAPAALDSSFIKAERLTDSFSFMKALTRS